MWVICEQRDVMEGGFGVQVDVVLLFNDLHCEQPIQLLRHAVAAGQEVLIIHWNCGGTPRGPSFDIRPRPEQMVDWGRAAGFEPACEILDLPPWHYGLRLLSTGSLGSAATAK